MKRLHFSFYRSFLKQLFLLGLLTFSTPVLSQPAVKNMWTVEHPFDQRVFVENKGQYKARHEKLSASDILFYSYFNGLEYFFTKNAIWISRSDAVKRSRRERRELERKFRRVNENEPEDEEEEEKENAWIQWKNKEQFYCMQFVGTGNECIVEGKNKVEQRFNYGIPDLTTIQAGGFGKIVYRNLYPGIDMEIVYPENKTGFEYRFVVKPGAQLEQIAIDYPFGQLEGLDVNGNKKIISSFGLFTEQAPQAIQSSKTIACNFVLKKNSSGFAVSNYDKTQTLLIDPWTIPPGFEENNRAWDIDWDNGGNCYIYGGGRPSTLPYELIKFNSNGVKVWSFLTHDIGYQAGRYADFAVDRETQSVYIISSQLMGGKTLKLNHLGIQTAIHELDSVMQEVWRITFNPCTHQAVIGGGGTRTPSDHACMLDTNMVTMNTVHVIDVNEGFHDVCSIVFDKQGNCFLLFSGSVVDTTKYNNALVKVPIPSLYPPIWVIPTHYVFEEAQGLWANITNGYNCMFFSNNKVYIYDTNDLKVYDAGTGAMLDSTSVNVSGNPSLMYFGGLTGDDCDHILLATDDHVQLKVNSIKNPITLFYTPDLISDLSLGRDNILYACGKGFVSASKVDLPECAPLNITSQITHASCSSNGSVTVFANGGTPPYTFSWNTTPVQTGNSISNLSPGTYIVTIKDASCPQKMKVDTVVIEGSGIPVIVTGSVPLTCNGEQGKISVSVNGGKRPYSYSWSPVTGNDSILSNIPAGTYTITVTTADGCKSTDSVHLSEPPTLQLALTSADEFCSNEQGTAIALASGGVPPYTFVWSNGNSSNALANLKAGSYSVSVKDKNDCSKTATVVIKNSGSVPQAAFTSDPLITDLSAPEIKFIDKSKGAVKWQWSFGDGGVDSVQNPLYSYKESGMYTVELQITNAQGCVSIATAMVIIRPHWSFYIPNSFTPDGDGVNDTFNGKGEGLHEYHLRIFDRWGEMIFETSSLSVHWDGRTHGYEIAQQDVYLYLVVLKDSKGSEHRYTGTVTLVK